MKKFYLKFGKRILVFILCFFMLFYSVFDSFSNVSEFKVVKADAVTIGFVGVSIGEAIATLLLVGFGIYVTYDVIESVAGGTTVDMPGVNTDTLEWWAAGAYVESTGESPDPGKDPRDNDKWKELAARVSIGGLAGVIAVNSMFGFMPEMVRRLSEGDVPNWGVRGSNSVSVAGDGNFRQYTISNNRVVLNESFIPIPAPGAFLSSEYLGSLYSSYSGIIAEHPAFFYNLNSNISSKNGNLYILDGGATVSIDLSNKNLTSVRSNGDNEFTMVGIDFYKLPASLIAPFNGTVRSFIFGNNAMTNMVLIDGYPIAKFVSPISFGEFTNIKDLRPDFISDVTVNRYSPYFRDSTVVDPDTGIEYQEIKTDDFLTREELEEVISDSEQLKKLSNSVQLQNQNTGEIVDNLNSIDDNSSSIWDSVKKLPTSIFNAFKGSLESIRKAISNLPTASQIADAFRSMIDNISDLLSRIVNTVKDILSNIADFFSNLMEFLNNTLSNILNSIKNVLSNILEFIKSIPENIINGIRDLFIPTDKNMQYVWAKGSKVIEEHFGINGTEFRSLLVEGVPFEDVKFHGAVVFSGTTINWFVDRIRPFLQFFIWFLMLIFVYNQVMSIFDKSGVSSRDN